MWQEQADQFLKISGQFRLGDLPTEQQNPRTLRLSELAKSNLNEAIDCLLAVERSALDVLLAQSDRLDALALDIEMTLDRGGRIFFCGCGATGRLSLSLERLWKELVGTNDDRVFSFMAGGDYALVHSIENFEDFPEYGARQLTDLGFADGDLLISTTEGGETPFVIGATLAAAKISSNRPYFLYCNPDRVLTEKLERCRQVIYNDRIKKISFEIGPMAVSGSTRLQATTVLMLAAGSALFHHRTEVEPSAEILDLKMRLKVGDFLGLVPLIEKESAYYSENIKVMHAASDYAITVLTDLTERSPTFSLDGLKNYLTSPSAPSSWTYLWVPGARDAEESWRQVLQREPRCLHWETFIEKYGFKAAMGFDFSDQGSASRKRDVAQSSVPLFRVDRDQREIRISHDEIIHRMPRPASLLVEHLLLKVALNISSNLVMCRMGRVMGNIMLWVHASNNKLIDRAARYVQYLFKDAGMANRFTYEDVVKEIFRLRADQQKSESIVLKTFNSLKTKT